MRVTSGSCGFCRLPAGTSPTAVSSEPASRVLETWYPGPGTHADWRPGRPARKSEVLIAKRCTHATAGRRRTGRLLELRSSSCLTRRPTPALPRPEERQPSGHRQRRIRARARSQVSPGLRQRRAIRRSRDHCTGAWLPKPRGSLHQSCFGANPGARTGAAPPLWKCLQRVAIRAG
jgi:hypothetical protein